MLPLPVAVLALLIVVGTLISVGSTTREIRDEIIHVVEPARNHLYELQRLLALEEAQERGGAPAPVVDSVLPPWGGATKAEQRILTALRPLARQIGPAALEALAEMRAHMEQWHARDRAPDGGPNLEPNPEADLAYASAVTAADKLHAVLNLAAEQRRARIAGLERVESALIIGMIVLALASVFVLAQTAQRQMQLARESWEVSTESELRRRELQRLSMEKAEFIRGVTHDLKNPLGVIDAYAELLEAEIKGSLTEDQRHFVARIRNAVRQVLGTVQDLLELAREETRGLSITRSTTDLSAVVTDLTENYTAALSAQGLRLVLDTAGDLPPVVTDARRVREVLSNLLSNASKYVPRGEQVTVRTRVQADGGPEPGSWLVVDVQDTGVGIAPEEQELIFQEFHRAAGQTAPGSGVGLTISRRIARLLGGDLTVRSRPGEGATFSLWIPFTAPALTGSSAGERRSGTAASRDHPPTSP